MKYILLLPILFILGTVSGKSYYASTTGSDSNPGTFDKPFASWEKLGSVLVAGDTGWVRGGTYRTTKLASTSVFCSINNKNGTSTNPIVIMAYPGEQPVFNLDNIKCTATGTPNIIQINSSSYLKVKGLRATGLAQNPSVSPASKQYTYGWGIYNCNNTTFEQCESDRNCEGFQVGGGYNYLFLNCDAHDNQDPYSSYAYNGSNGFSCTGQPASVNVTYRGCRAWYNCDDGFDIYGSDGMFVYENCESFWNGYVPGDRTRPVGNGNGFKLGPSSAMPTVIKHILTKCISFENRAQGFDQNNGQCINQIVNCTTYGNGNNGYLMCANNIKNVLTNNISYSDQSQVCAGMSVSTNNTWNGKTGVAADFVSTSSTGMNAPRKADGSFPDNNFMYLTANSNLKGMGAYPSITPPPPSDTAVATWSNVIVNNITWTVVKEQTGSIYIIERSSDGISYSQVGSVPANGSKSYNFTNNMTGSTQLYYRIKVGSVVISKILGISLQTTLLQTTIQ